MRILDDDADKKLDQVMLFLTRAEARQMIGYLEGLLADPKLNQHAHLSSEDYKKEITVCVYNPENLEDLHERAKKLILEDV